MGLRAVTSYGREAGSARVRIFDWLSHLGLDNASVFTYTNGSDNSAGTLLRKPAAILAAEKRLRQIATNSGDCTILLSRRASPFSRGSVERALMKHARWGVYDFDDAIMLDTGRLGGMVPGDGQRWRAAVESADIVLAGNSFLADTAARHNRNVKLIPSCVQPGQYSVKSSYELTTKVPVAVWLGSPSTEKYLLTISDALLAEHRRTGLRLSLISAGANSLGPLDQMIDRRTWSLETYAAELTRGDFGIMPLPDTPWTRGKCAYKLLQYGAAGLPAIASPVGANREAIKALGSFSAGTAMQWKEALAELSDATPQDRAILGEGARAGVIRHYSFERWEKEWKSAVLCS